MVLLLVFMQLTRDLFAIAKFLFLYNIVYGRAVTCMRTAHAMDYLRRRVSVSVFSLMYSCSVVSVWTLWASSDCSILNELCNLVMIMVNYDTC